MSQPLLQSYAGTPHIPEADAPLIARILCQTRAVADGALICSPRTAEDAVTRVQRLSRNASSFLAETGPWCAALPALQSPATKGRDWLHDALYRPYPP